MKTPLTLIVIAGLILLTVPISSADETVDAAFTRPTIPIAGIGDHLYTAFGSWETDFQMPTRYDGNGHWSARRTFGDYLVSFTMDGDTKGPVLHRFTATILHTGTGPVDPEFIVSNFCGGVAWLFGNHSQDDLKAWIQSHAETSEPAVTTIGDRLLRLERAGTTLYFTMVADPKAKPLKPTPGSPLAKRLAPAR